MGSDPRVISILQEDDTTSDKLTSDYQQLCKWPILEFTKVVKEVKVMTQARGLRIHQYLDDW